MVDQRDILMVEGLKQGAKDNDVNLIVYCGGMIVFPQVLPDDKRSITVS